MKTEDFCPRTATAVFPPPVAAFIAYSTGRICIHLYQIRNDMESNTYLVNVSLWTKDCDVSVEISFSCAHFYSKREPAQDLIVMRNKMEYAEESYFLQYNYLTGAAAGSYVENIVSWSCRNFQPCQIWQNEKLLDCCDFFGAPKQIGARNHWKSKMKRPPGWWDLLHAMLSDFITNAQ